MNQPSKRDIRFSEDKKYREHSCRDLAKRFDFHFIKSGLDGETFIGCGFKSTVDGKCEIVYNAENNMVTIKLIHPKRGPSIHVRKIKYRKHLELLFKYPRMHSIEKR
jgi:hypothetical protein